MQRLIIALVYFVLVSSYSLGQDSSTSDDLEIIYSETFDWENPDDPRGWTMPDGYYMEDPNDTGFNWHWWPNDSLVADLTFEPPFRSTSASDGQLCLFANLYNNYVDAPARTSINNSIVFPLIDCSEHASVIVRFQTSFQNYGWENFDLWSNLVEVSNNYGVHWASFNAGFGCGHKDRPNDEPGDSAIIDHFIGSKFPIYGDCELVGVSAYIMGGLADGLIDFRYVVFQEVTDENGEIIDRDLFLSTEYVDLDSSMFNQWVYLPIDKDGESEFVSAETVLYAGIQYSDFHPDQMTRRNQGLSIGADNSSPNHDPRAVGLYRTSVWDGSQYITERNLMVRLLINDHSDLSGRNNVLTTPLSLNQNYPNPFAEETNITYILTRSAPIDIVIRDITGRPVKVINEGLRPIGEHSFTLKAMELGAGLYTYTIIAGNIRETKQMIISR
ncbi:MAG: T9SS type A sorting domain-containing protein [Bacteroidetes bacterium]|jgi:hypothetical protein|nr:T9SS type A sorting domain-containing protein [Bacteroidota bacterium]MBT4398122.1 T9SS type A sorting domain-containing protein [Bacteroidota bacterium]MBT4408756.1 T9SS type A sorting domain-containing protein [Bacteroidota bacterium]MBT7094291.1 T9SS type A sorting domain-containing protein [Bacteroidota bacterium]MBT7465194.1 T9SS type A sorting domain-containing protein [Bacteroidota bacterium]